MVFELVDTSTSPLDSAIYNPNTGKLDLVFDWNKLLQATGTWGDARHIDAVVFNGKPYEIGIHDNDGPRDANGKYIYNRDTMENEFSIFVGKGFDPADGTIDLKLTDRADGRKPLYDFELVENGTPAPPVDEPEPDPDPEPPAQQPDGLVYALNVGGNAYTASNGVTYQGDDLDAVREYSTKAGIKGTTDDTLYQSERSELDGGFTYETTVANGTYEVELNFAEIYSRAQDAGDRVFDVYVEGALAFEDVDIAAVVGYRTAYDVTTSTTVSDGSLTIQLVSNVENAKLSAFSVWESDGAAPVDPPEEPVDPPEEPMDPPEDPVDGPAQLVYALNVGGAAYTASNGVTYQGDDLDAVREWTTKASISGTVDDALYQSERSEFNGGFTYETAVANGEYEVELNFAEIYHRAQDAGDRVFDVYVEGALAFEDFDIAAAAGYRTAYDVTTSTTVSDGSLTIQLVSNVENAKLSAFSIWTPGGEGPVDPPEEPVDPPVEPVDPPNTGLPTLVYALNAGGQGFTAANGVVYEGDDLRAVREWATDDTVSGTPDEVLYQSERSERSGGFTYETAVQNGFYDVELNFAEIWRGAKEAGKRVFDVFVEDQLVIRDLDIADEAGYLTALDYIGAVEVTDGALTITVDASVENAKLSGFSIWEAGGALTDQFDVGSLYDDLIF